MLLSVLWSALLLACGGNTNERQTASKQRQNFVMAKVLHEAREVQIFTNGVPQAWEKTELSVPDSAILIALLVEEHTSVKKGDLLASLLTFAGKEEYVPVNLISPIDGVVTGVDYKLQAHIPAGRRIIEIKNFDHYILKVNLASFQLDYIKRDTPAELLLDKARLKARVYEIDRSRNEVVLLTEPVSGLTIDEEILPVRIVFPHIKGSYLPERFFMQADSLPILLQDSIALEIYAVGKSDSLVLIHPPLPDVQALKIRLGENGED